MPSSLSPQKYRHSGSSDECRRWTATPVADETVLSRSASDPAECSLQVGLSLSYSPFFLLCKTRLSLQSTQDVCFSIHCRQNMRSHLVDLASFALAASGTTTRTLWSNYTTVQMYSVVSPSTLTLTTSDWTSKACSGLGSPSQRMATFTAASDLPEASLGTRFDPQPRKSTNRAITTGRTPSCSDTSTTCSTANTWPAVSSSNGSSTAVSQRLGVSTAGTGAPDASVNRSPDPKEPNSAQATARYTFILDIAIDRNVGLGILEPFASDGLTPPSAIPTPPAYSMALTVTVAVPTPTSSTILYGCAPVTSASTRSSTELPDILDRVGQWEIDIYAIFEVVLKAFEMILDLVRIILDIRQLVKLAEIVGILRPRRVEV
ncbi:hypothetical protein BAUCODRAFT_125579 [Baudoinia panamericana UAMH 10762]|uniref:Uncharacterized protein n=1 Tax=Baudoinia panamericana (strain UAMH 10762) TaxID=717646 RepID=M2N108_BAUPA|nr:uncharacterized protein BAUCODRAFT_125579 [Baudoinia panamericana UAMH 10762]EMC92594.1 hypothetical protein BAUCODRAFT_125579 [Baudoinia panamericana UAMH 10762]